MPARAVCPYCKGTSIEDNGAGDICCTNCAAVLEDSQIVAEVTFGETTSGAAMVHGSFIGEHQSYARGGGGFRKNGSWESREQTFANGKRRIMNLAHALKLPEFIGEAANRWFQLAVTQNFVQGRRSQYVVAACLYVACRQQETTHMLIDFADLLQVSVFAIGATYLKLVKVLQIKKIPLIDPSIYIQRFAVKLEFGPETRKVMNDAVRLVQRMGKDWLHQGRRPAGVAGACILVAARMNNFRRSKAEIVHVAKVAEDTIQRRLDEFKLTAAGALTVQDFRGTNIESEADPPSFTKHRKRELAEQREHEAKLEAADADAHIGDDNEEAEKEVAQDLDATLKDQSFQKLSELIRADSTSAASKRDFDDDPEHLSDVDDDEIQSFMLSEKEVEVKSKLWMDLNQDYLKEQELKQIKLEADQKAGIVRVPRKRKRNKPRDSTTENLPETPAESAKAMLQKKAFSKKINYAALDHLFNKAKK
ncbi:Brf1-like TBP-binding domain-containing protein [Lipomyces tetrasporus]|uniref:B-related factor 1 n=1 Tax=Lipomyces tetrasporus TaxID=54092 RepID=A0AAD7QVW3_9ASCO|nr:Brf1-like TBP-binding domain-containing protein [Lipomyces tetrasporus]KAJ8101811.1 Brf1-like TBP-binding domain-containing protein [Lipomyces tetrasporus]